MRLAQSTFVQLSFSYIQISKLNQIFNFEKKLKRSRSSPTVFRWYIVVDLKTHSKTSRFTIFDEPMLSSSNVFTNQTYIEMEKKDILTDTDNSLWIWLNIWTLAAGLGRISRHQRRIRRFHLLSFFRSSVGPQCYGIQYRLHSVLINGQNFSRKISGSKSKIFWCLTGSFERIHRQ